MAEARHHILYLISQLGPGGSEKQLFGLLQAMDRQKYFPTVAVWNFREHDVYVSQIRALGVQVLSISNTSHSIIKLLSFMRLVMRLRPGVIHSFTFYTNIAAFCGALIAYSVAIGSLRGDLQQTLYDTGGILGRLCLRYPRFQICNSSIVAEKVKQLGGFFGPKCLCVVRNGLDCSLFNREHWPFSKRAEILAIGSLLAYKRWDRLIDAAADLKKKGYDFLVRIAGSGPLEFSLKQQAQTLGVTDCVEFLGFCENIPDLLASSSFLVHTSDTEGLPNAIIEAMASGRAVVATDVGEVPMLVEEGTTGFIVKRNDKDELVERLAFLIRDSERCAQMGIAGRDKVRKEFGVNQHIVKTFEAYHLAGWKEA